jgi:hypothetical protein
MSRRRAGTWLEGTVNPSTKMETPAKRAEVEVDASASNFAASLLFFADM